MLLKEIEQKLQELDPNVYYGAAWKHQAETIWDYIVFNRKVIKHSTNKTSDSDYFEVHIVRENYVPEGFDTVVINKVCEIAGVRLAGTDSPFDYMQKPNTNTVCEMLTITFVKARKNDV